MHKPIYSQTTRRRALDAANSLDTDKLLDVIRVAPVNNYFMKSIDSAIQKDREAMRSWLPSTSDDVPEHVFRSGPSEESKLLNLIRRTAREDVPNLGPIGAKRISRDYNNATNITLGSALAQGDNLHVKTPSSAFRKNEAKKDRDEVSSQEETSSNDLGGFGEYS